MKQESIYFWPKWINSDYEIKKPINYRELQKICQAQVHLWQALNIYDDFLDNKGKPIALPSANIHFYEFISIHYNLNLSSNFYSLFNVLVNISESANREEVIYRHLKIVNNKLTIPKTSRNLPELSTLSQRSIVLSLGPIAALISQGYSTDCQQVRSVINFFKHALAAKQLSDDAKDWLDDLKSGSITYVNSLVLKELNTQFHIIDFNKDIIKILLAFSRVAPQISQQILHLSSLANKEMSRFCAHHQSLAYINIVQPLEIAAQKALQFQQILLEQDNNGII